LVFIGGQAQIESHGLLEADGLLGAAGYYQCQALMGPGALADGQGVAAAMQLPPDAVIRSLDRCDRRNQCGVSVGVGGGLRHGLVLSPGCIGSRGVARRVFYRPEVSLS